MRIDYCEYSQYCGDKGNEQNPKELWYCPWSGNKELCKYESCEMPPEKHREPPKPHPIKTDEDLDTEETLAKHKLMAERFTMLKQMEEEGLSRSKAAQRARISYYTIESIEEIFGYKFNFAIVKKISWPEYDAQIIALKIDNPKMTSEQVAKIIGLNHKVVANRIAKLKAKINKG